MLPKMAFTGFASRYREPSSTEGFVDITRVDFHVSFYFVMPRGMLCNVGFPFADRLLCDSFRERRSKGGYGAGIGCRRVKMCEVRRAHREKVE